MLTPLSKFSDSKHQQSMINSPLLKNLAFLVQNNSVTFAVHVLTVDIHG